MVNTQLSCFYWSKMQDVFLIGQEMINFILAPDSFPFTSLFIMLFRAKVADGFLCYSKTCSFISRSSKAFQPFLHLISNRVTGVKDAPFHSPYSRRRQLFLRSTFLSTLRLFVLVLRSMTCRKYKMFFRQVLNSIYLFSLQIGGFHRIEK